MSAGSPRSRALLLLALWGVALGVWGAAALSPGYDPHLGSATAELLTVVLPQVPLVAVAAVLVWRVPGHGVTRVLAVMAACGALGLLAPGLLDGRTASHGGWDLPWVLSGLAWLGGLPMLPLLFLLFPTGAPPSPRWRPVLHAQLAALAGLVALVVTDADPARGLPLALAVSAAGVLVTGAALAAVGLVLRWIRAAGDERRQLLAFALVAAATAGWYVIGGIVTFGLGAEVPEPAVAVPVILTAPVLATGYAVARHHLYGIDPVVNRFAVWGLVTAVLLGGYLGAVALLTAVTGAGEGSPVVAALTAVAVAVCLYPVRVRTQRVVDRVMYGARDDPLAVLRAVGARLSAAVGPAEVGSEVVRTAADSLRLPWVALDLETEGTWNRVAEVGAPGAGDPCVVPIRDAGEDVGRLLAGARRGESRLAERDAHLLRDLATQAAPAVRSARLLTELADSRDRLVQARESERQRLRRDLHDGLSPALSGIGLTADTARRLLVSQPTLVDDLLARIAGEARGSADVVRRMLADLRPAALEDAGLVAALTDRASRLSRPEEFDVRVRACDGVDGLRGAVQVAAYRIVVEAMANAARHSGGTTCEVSLERVDGHLRITVRDDGRSPLEGVLPGVGLGSMRERAEEVGGRLVLDRDRHGLTVTADLPVLMESP